MEQAPQTLPESQLQKVDVKMTEPTRDRVLIATETGLVVLGLGGGTQVPLVAITC